MTATDSTNGHASKRAALYVRVSTDEQAKSGYSLSDQRRALEAHAGALGYNIVEPPIEDDGYSGTTPDRPGLMRVLELAEAGRIDVVLAITRDRFWRSSLYRKLMDRDLQEFGVRAVALNDLEGGGVAGRLGNAFLDEYAEYELEVIKERTNKGKMQKVREGKLLAFRRSNYGFGYTDDRDAYEVDPDTMPHVRTIFRMVGVEGSGVSGAARRLNVAGVPSPSGGASWNTAAIRDTIKHDVYRPHTHAELSRLVEDGRLESGVLASLDPDKSYGVWWYRKDSPESVAVPVADAGIPPAWVEAARAALAFNARPVRKDERVYELSGGVLHCVCGRKMTTNMNIKTTKGGEKKRRPKYVCTRRDVDACGNKQHNAAELEQKVAGMVAALLEDPAPLVASIQDRIDAERRKMRSPDKEVKSLHAEITDLDAERKGYLRQNAQGVIEDEELALELDRIKTERNAAAAALERVEHRQAHIHQLERDAAFVLYLYASGVAAEFDKLPPAERKDFYRRALVRVFVGRDGMPELTADLASPALLPDVEAAREAVRERARYADRDARLEEDPHAIEHTGEPGYIIRDGAKQVLVFGPGGAHGYTVPEGIWRAYKELTGVRRKGQRAPSSTRLSMAMGRTGAPMTV